MEVDGFVMEPVMLCTDGPFFLFAVTSIFYPTVCGLVSPSTSYTIIQGRLGESVTQAEPVPPLSLSLSFKKE
jgi:polyferredoxin